MELRSAPQPAAQSAGLELEIAGGCRGRKCEGLCGKMDPRVLVKDSRRVDVAYASQQLESFLETASAWSSDLRITEGLHAIQQSFGSLSPATNALANEVAGVHPGQQAWAAAGKRRRSGEEASEQQVKKHRKSEKKAKKDKKKKSKKSKKKSGRQSKTES